jgi:nitrite reductase/ring-hydroxylating ferredoxin subunit
MSSALPWRDNEFRINDVPPESAITCPWHGSQFDGCTGAVLRGPAKDPLRTFAVTVDGDIGRVEARIPSAR